MHQNSEMLNKYNEIVALFRDEQENKKKETLGILQEVFHDAVINNKDVLCARIRSVWSANGLAEYMRNGQFAEDAIDDFVAQMMAATINSSIEQDYDEFIKTVCDLLKIYNYDVISFEQFSQTWNNKFMQQTMENVQNRRLNIVEIGTGIGSEAAKKLHGFLFGKVTEITITVIRKNPDLGKQAGKVMRQYLGKGAFKAQKNVLADHVSQNIDEYATELAQWGCDGYNDIYNARIKMAEQLLPAYMETM